MQNTDISIPKNKKTILLSKYLSTRYPYELIYEMISAGHAENREFGFFIRTEDAGDEIALRHLSFSSSSEMHQYIETKKPFRIEIGASWSIRPKMHRFLQTEPTHPCYRELVFDIDIDSYDGSSSIPNYANLLGTARLCCSGSDWCPSCWPIIGYGCTILDCGLKMLGANKIGWFFSGRRGIHGWILDSEFSSTDEGARNALCNYVAPRDPDHILMSAFHGDQPSMIIISKLVAIPRKLNSNHVFLNWYFPRHPTCALSALTAALQKHNELIDDADGEITYEILRLTKNISTTELAINKLRNLRGKLNEDITIDNIETNDVIHIKKLIENLKIKISHSLDLWNDGRFNNLSSIVIWAALACLLPRIDIPVTRQKNHLLRSPMIVHSDTMKLGMYIPIDIMTTFLPSDAPTLTHKNNLNVVEFDNELVVRKTFFDFSEWIKKK